MTSPPPKAESSSSAWSSPPLSRRSVMSPGFPFLLKLCILPGKFPAIRDLTMDFFKCFLCEDAGEEGKGHELKSNSSCLFSLHLFLSFDDAPDNSCLHVQYKVLLMINLLDISVIKVRKTTRDFICFLLLL